MKNHKWYTMHVTLECKECGGSWQVEHSRVVRIGSCPGCHWSNENQNTFEQKFEKKP